MENKFIGHCGIRAIYDETGFVEVEFEIDEKHLNPWGFVHGGMLYTLADTAAGHFLRSQGGSGVTLDSSFHFLSNRSTGKVTARVEPVRSGRTITVLRTILTAEDGETLAEGTFTYYTKR